MENNIEVFNKKERKKKKEKIDSLCLPFLIHFVLPKSIYAFFLETSYIRWTLLIKIVKLTNNQRKHWKKMLNQNISLPWENKYKKNARDES